MRLLHLADKNIPSFMECTIFSCVLHIIFHFVQRYFGKHHKMIPFISLQKRTQLHADEINKAVAEVVNSGWYLLGKWLNQFEQEYADYIGTRHCIGVSNGLDAITLIFRAYIEMGRIQPGDEVIVPANTYIASILGITENGLRPVLVEPDVHTLLMDPALIEQHITSKTKSILMVHLYGRCAWSKTVQDVCQKYGLLLVEDNAQAHGCRCAAGMTGALGDAAAHSFYPTKNLGALGDAGAVTTDDDQLAEVLRAMRNYGSSRKYIFDYKGRNCRMDEIQAAVLSVKLKYLDEENEKRRQIAALYHEQLTSPYVKLPGFKNNVWHLFPILCSEDKGLTECESNAPSVRDRLHDFLVTEGIETQVHYPVPPHRQQCYAEFSSLSLPVTDYIHASELSLPIGPELSLNDVVRVADAINHFELT